LTTEHDSDALRPGVVLVEQYEILKVLGQGGFGITYLAKDLRLDQQVAIKEFLPESIAVRGNDATTVRPKSKSHVDDFKNFKDRFLDEARTLARFKHANMVRIQNYFETGGTTYFAMEYEEGESLDAKLTRVGKLKEKDALNLVLPLLNGLEVLHKAGMIHRDIKPANIYIRTDGSPVLLDFGAARSDAGSGGKTTMTSMLTPGYAPIEQYYTDAKQQGPWTDIYGMGGVLYRCITGRRVVEASSRSAARLRDKPDPMKLASVVAHKRYHEYFLYAIDHALMVLGEERPQNVTEWRKELTGKTPPPIPMNLDPDLVQEQPGAREGKTQMTSTDLSIGGLNVKTQRKPVAKKKTQLRKKKQNTQFGKTTRRGANTQIGQTATKSRKGLWGMLGLAACAIIGGGVYWKFEIYDKSRPWIDPLTKMPFVYVPGGCFSMGSPAEEKGRYEDEHPHQACVEGMWLSQYETTQAAWQKVMKSNPAAFKRGSQYPVERVSYYDVQKFLKRLNKKSEYSFRLPTEAEWEYAARGGVQTAYYWGKFAGRNKANCGGCKTQWSNVSSAEVGTFEANAFKLYDMLGNVQEWTCSAVNKSYDGSEKRCSDNAIKRVLRGGSWSNDAQDARSAYRDSQTSSYRHSTIGFRLLRR